ncbi:hypothetical protein BRSPCE3_41110 [Bradyrhizobium sp. Ce-3]|nr:hypothetical protein BRSPCE3_41110 [Bradyrhizobium sp. Ce-3]
MDDLAPIAALNVKRIINGHVLHGDTIDGSGSALSSSVAPEGEGSSGDK